MLESIDPTSGEKLRAYETTSLEETLKIVEVAAASAASWPRSTGFDERSALLRRVAELLRGRADSFAELMAREMGKPLAQGRSEVEKCAWVCDHYAEEAARYLAEQPIEADRDKSYVAYRPLGLVLAIMPWNFPFWQVFRFAAPAVMAGNGALLKHASNVTGCALAIEKLFHDAGAPDNLFRCLLIGKDLVPRVLEHPKVRAATLTGSTRAGRAVAQEAGERLKKVVLELGGSDPYLILEDADLEAAIETCAKSRLINSGQSCIAAKRFLVTRAVYPRFVEGLVEKMREAKMGSPLDEEVDLGPQARLDLRDGLADQVERSVAAGAKVALGCEVPDGPGAFYPASVLLDVEPGMPAFDEELFGPVAAVTAVDDEVGAIELANRTSYGLGAAVFTRDLERGERIARDHLDAGCCFVNALVASDPRLPFGGVKESGFGRELGPLGIREFVNAKTVVVG